MAMSDTVRTSRELAQDVRRGTVKLKDVAPTKRERVERLLRTMNDLELGDPHELPSPGPVTSAPIRVRSG
jgi:hypothetical protein